MDMLNCMHPLEQIRVLVMFEKIFETKHKSKVRIFCIQCNMDLQQENKQAKIALTIVKQQFGKKSGDK